MNTEIAVIINNLTKEFKKETDLRTFIHITDNQLCNFFQINGFQTGENSKLEFFNIFNLGAKSLIQNYPLFDNEIIKKENLHILIIGLGRTGENLLLHAARSWKFKYSMKSKLKITIIDNKAEMILKKLKAKMHINDVCELVPKEMDINSDEFISGKYLFGDKCCCEFDKIYICLKNDSESMYTSMHIADFISNSNPDNNIDIVVKFNKSRGLSSVFEKKNYKENDPDSDSSLFKNIKIFKLFEETCTPNFIIKGKITKLAMKFHDYFSNEKKKSGKKVDPAETAEWHNLKEGYTNNNEYAARKIFEVIKDNDYKVSIQKNLQKNEFSEEEIHKMASRLHQLWVDKQISEGWECGPEKNNEKRTNPTLKDFNLLTKEEQKFNLGLIRNLPDWLSEIGIQVTKKGKKEKISFL